MTTCTCEPRAFPATDCPKHGLYGAIRFPPMDRHARQRPCRAHGDPTCHSCYTARETAAETQERLYREARHVRLRFPVRTLPFREAMSQR